MKTMLTIFAGKKEAEGRAYFLPVRPGPRALLCALAFLLCLSLLPGNPALTNALAETVAYIDENGVEQTASGVTVLDGGMAELSGWYMVKDDVVFGQRLFLAGETHIILCDGATLYADTGIEVRNPLTIYGQKGGTGSLIASIIDKNCKNAAIGGSAKRYHAEITICGGNVQAFAVGGAIPSLGAAIGGGAYHSGGKILITGGNVYAKSGGMGAAIGGGYEGGPAHVTIRGGTVYAVGNSRYGAEGIGHGRGDHLRDGLSYLNLYCMRIVDYEEGDSDEENKLVQLEPCTSHEYESGKCVYCGKREVKTDPVAYKALDGTIQECTAWMQVTADMETLGTDSDWYVVTQNITCKKKIKVVGSVNLVLCDGAELKLKKRFVVPSGASLTIWQQSGGTGRLTAEAGIGGDSGDGGVITVNGGTVTATGGGHDAGIGGAVLGGGTVTINGGSVTATGGYGAAGIGGGQYGNGGTITINGGAVTATGGGYGAGIGGGEEGGGGTVTIRGGQVRADSENGYGIGPGKADDPTQEGAPGSVTLRWNSAFCYIQTPSIKAGVYVLENPFRYRTRISGGKDRGEVTPENLPSKDESYVIGPSDRTEAAVSIGGGQKLHVGDQLTLTAETDADTVDGEWTWRSSAPEVAAVDENGIVTALGEGTARIMAAFESAAAFGEASVGLTVTGTYDVTAEVNNGSVTVDPASARPGETVALSFSPNEGYSQLKTLLALNGAETVETVQTGEYTYTFRMPAGDVNVVAAFQEPETYSVYFVNWNGRTLQWMECTEGTMPEYTGNTPEREPTDRYVFTFADWGREIVPVTEDTVYRATYTSAPRPYSVTFLDWNGDVLFETQTPYGETPVYTGETPERPGSEQTLYAFAGWTPGIVPVTGEAVYTAVYGETRLLLEGENAVSLPYYEEKEWHFTASADGYYRFRAAGSDLNLQAAIYDGDGNRMVSGDYALDFYAHLAGGGTYTVRLRSLNGPAELTLSVESVPTYQIHLVNEEPYGYIEIGDGCSAYEGKYISIYSFINLDYYDSYDFVDVTATNAEGETVEISEGLFMPGFDIWLRPVFQRMQPIAIVMDDMIDIPSVETEDHMYSWDNAASAEGKTIRIYAYSMLEDEEIGEVTVTAQDGTSIPCTYEEVTEMGLPCYWFVMPDCPVTVRMRLTGTAPDFGTPDVTLPANLTAIEESAFEGDESICVVEIPFGCQSIGKWAFKDCAYLCMIRVPADCAVGEDAFAGCEEVYVYGAVNSPAWEYCQSHDNCTFVEE